MGREEGLGWARIYFLYLWDVWFYLQTVIANSVGQLVEQINFFSSLQRSITYERGSMCRCFKDSSNRLLIASCCVHTRDTSLGWACLYPTVAERLRVPNQCRTGPGATASVSAMGIHPKYSWSLSAVFVLWYSPCCCPILGVYFRPALGAYTLTHVLLRTRSIHVHPPERGGTIGCHVTPRCQITSMHFNSHRSLTGGAAVESRTRVRLGLIHTGTTADAASKQVIPLPPFLPSSLLLPSTLRGVAVLLRVHISRDM